MILFASDLDRTLIYSQKMINEYGDRKDIHIAETKDGEPITYITQKAVDLLQQACESSLFVPVTTRTKEQYFRISIINEDIAPKYAITENGGNIWVNGNQSVEWNEVMKSRIGEECLAIKDVAARFGEIQDDTWVKFFREIDGLFAYCIFYEKTAPFEELRLLMEYLKENNWKTVQHGRKMYFVPNCLTKSSAVEYIAEKEDISHIAGAGDSLLDLDIADVADTFISPLHGQIYDSFGDSRKYGDISYTEAQGIEAGEEILENIVDMISQEQLDKETVKGEMRNA